MHFKKYIYTEGACEYVFGPVVYLAEIKNGSTLDLQKDFF